LNTWLEKHKDDEVPVNRHTYEELAPWFDQLEAKLLQDKADAEAKEAGALKNENS